MTEISDEELERRMRAKLFGSEPSGKGGPKLGATELKIAEKLMGKSNAQRLAHSDRPFRYRAPVVTAEYYHTPDGEYHRGGWCLDMIEDGVRRKVIERGTWREVSIKIRELSEKNITVKKFETERMIAEAERRRADAGVKKAGNRGGIMNRLKEFRL
ncbi:hypothetical protein [Brucella sp. JSBI001]|uniref:hypothetical protein n=1 Tax=Brucella sp. JSBI001 TaxID=2886044 RepID=UPI00222F3A9D|nr:hypothetical protein [Brucella sp. JSBI001]UZD70875.1 hypothetical protein LJ361_05500 [Brucella sp. JSBI001]